MGRGGPTRVATRTDTEPRHLSPNTSFAFAITVGVRMGQPGPGLQLRAVRAMATGSATAWTYTAAIPARRADARICATTALSSPQAAAR